MNQVFSIQLKQSTLLPYTKKWMEGPISIEMCTMLMELCNKEAHGMVYYKEITIIKDHSY